jgi:hypothetical protein
LSDFTTVKIKFDGNQQINKFMTTTTATAKPATTEPRKVQDSNVYRLANRIQPRKAMFLSKIIMKKHGSIQIESVGIATSEASKLAQMLTKHGYANLKSIRTEQFNPESDGRRFQVKLYILLEKSSQFDKLTEDIELRKE